DVLPLLRRQVELEEAVVGLGLHVGQVGHLDGVAEAAEVADLRRVDHAPGRDWHGACPLLRQKDGGGAVLRPGNRAGAVLPECRPPILVGATDVPMRAPVRTVSGKGSRAWGLADASHAASTSRTTGLPAGPRGDLR